MATFAPLHFSLLNQRHDLTDVVWPRMNEQTVSTFAFIAICVLLKQYIDHADTEVMINFTFIMHSCENIILQ